jgi:hypothetical protein
MNAFFLGVCGMSLVFFGFFLLACHRDMSRRKSRIPTVTKIVPGTQAFDSLVEGHPLIRLEREMADFLTRHRSVGAAEGSRATSVGPAIQP